MRYINNITEFNSIFVSFNANNDYFINTIVSGKYKSYKIYMSNKGYFINYKNKRYYLGFSI